jgi:hypothetical protein
VVAVVALALAGYVTKGLLTNPYDHVLTNNVADQSLFEWVLAYGVYVLGHGADPYFTTLMNVPFGVNLASNTSVTAYAVLFAPLTRLAGVQVTFVTILVLNLAGSAFAWYLFLQRWLVKSRVAAAIAGLFCGFAPGMISHANGHLNFTSAWVAPLLLWWVLKLREPGRWLRNGAILGVLVAVCFSVAAEGLFLVALACGIFVFVWSLSRATWAEARAAAPTMLAALGVTAAVAGALLAYPLYMFLAGPQHFSGTGMNQQKYAEDLGAYLSYPTRSLAGWAGLSDPQMAPNRTEENSFLGPVLLVLLMVTLIVLYRRAAPGRRATLRALVTVGAAFLLMSVGPHLEVLHHQTDIAMPYAVLRHLPMFDSALPARFALVVTAVAAIVLALAADHLVSRSPRWSWASIAGVAVFAVALLPLVPLPVKTRNRTPEPAFIAQGLWKQYVPENGVLSPLPFTNNVTNDGFRWQAYTMARGGRQFRIPDGYLLVPGTKGADGRGQLGPTPRPTSALFYRAAVQNKVSPITETDRTRARRDFAYWDLDGVFLADEINGPGGRMHRDAAATVATDLLGPPQRVGGVLFWPIRPGVDPVPGRAGVKG